ncbi:uncharacterized protein LOC141619033 [Silene latifolia]|uniref:uncharacterized protein LOC141619033 n=1 Tax=Silene latifolia TaxID=37657 RepID=UPI003D77318A
MQCVRSTTFTLSLNGNNFGYFQGQRGLRQGDPISPLLFTICMEYLTRLIKFATDRWPFQYHPLCKNLKLTHLMFADDLLLFCKGKPQSIWLLMRAFSSFSKASGLAMNNSKSEIFFNGVPEDIREGIKQVTVVTLINAVLNTLQNYWAQMFIIPKCIINHIMAICRNFLWDGSSDYHRVPLVAWDKVTLPKKEGGLGIKKADIWNIATVGKRDVYIKEQDWHTYSPPADATWVWKNTCLLHWFGGSFPTVGTLSAASRNTIQWKFRVAVFNAYCYTIWSQRNNARINAWLVRPEAVAARIEDDIRRRVKMKCKALVDQSDLLWLQSMNLA